MLYFLKYIYNNLLIFSTENVKWHVFFHYICVVYLRECFLCVFAGIKIKRVQQLLEMTEEYASSSTLHFFVHSAST